MNRIVHISLKVDDVKRTGDFYQEVFGFRDSETRKTRDHLSRHMTDGVIDFTLMKYDAGTQSKESKAAGDGPCIHHFAIEVDDIEGATEQIRKWGCEIVSDAGVIPVKFRALGGTVAELVPIGRYQRLAESRDIDKIVHLSLKVDDVQKTGDFYQQVFGFKDAVTRKTRDHLSRHMSDGVIDFTLMKYDAGTQSAESKAAGDGPCIHHFAIEVPDIAAATEAIRGRGCTIVSDPGVIPVKFRAPGGTVAELVPIGRYKSVAADHKVDRIVHLSLKVDELQKTGEFYQQVFGFRDAVTRKTRDHTSRHMTDGQIDFTLMQYDAGTTSKESTAAGEGPCIHHFAIEVEDIARATEQIKSYGSEVVSDPGVIPVKFRAPGGTIAELVPVGRYTA